MAGSKKRRDKLSNGSIRYADDIKHMINTSPTDGYVNEVTVVFSMSPLDGFDGIWIVHVNGSVNPREAAIHASSIIPVTAPIELYVNGKLVDMSDFNVAY